MITPDDRIFLEKCTQYCSHHQTKGEAHQKQTSDIFKNSPKPASHLASLLREEVRSNRTGHWCLCHGSRHPICVAMSAAACTKYLPVIATLQDGTREAFHLAFDLGDFCKGSSFCTYRENKPNFTAIDDALVQSSLDMYDQDLFRENEMAHVCNSLRTSAAQMARVGIRGFMARSIQLLGEMQSYRFVDRIVPKCLAEAGLPTELQTMICSAYLSTYDLPCDERKWRQAWEAQRPETPSGPCSRRGTFVEQRWFRQGCGHPTCLVDSEPVWLSEERRFGWYHDTRRPGGRIEKTICRRKDCQGHHESEFPDADLNGDPFPSSDEATNVTESRTCGS